MRVPKSSVDKLTWSMCVCGPSLFHMLEGHFRVKLDMWRDRAGFSPPPYSVFCLGHFRVKLDMWRDRAGFSPSPPPRILSFVWVTLE